jgi:lysophospholipase L1-like esterase
VAARLLRLVGLVLGNVAIFAVLCSVLELGVRIHRDGFRETWSRLRHGEPAPYSSLGTGKWVIDDPELGYRLNPEHDGINALSIRHAEVTIPKPAGLFRLVVLGDSIPWGKGTFGFVEDLATRIESLGAVEVINAAVPGYTSFQELGFFKRYVLQVDPDLVVWTYCLNDNHKFLHRFDQGANMLFTEEAARSLEIRSWWDWIVSRSYVLTTIRVGLLARQEPTAPRNVTFGWEARPDFNIAWKDYSWPFYEGHLAEMVELLARRGTRLALVVFPYEPQLLHRTRRDRRDEILAPQRHLAGLCRKYSVACLDLYPAFEQAYDRHRTLYRDGIHLNAEGHALTTVELLRFLDAHRLLPAARVPAAGPVPTSPAQGR